jgi:hypothetical protein
MSLFFKDDNEKEKKVEKKTAPVQTNTNAIPPTPLNFGATTIPQTMPTTPTVGAGMATPEYLDYFKKVFTDRNIPGPDYFEFVNALEMMKDQPIPEQQKFFGVYVGFASQGVTKDRLIQTAQQYIATFQEKSDGFAKALDVEFANAVESRHKQIDALKSDNEKLNQQMVEIQNKILKNTEQSGVLLQEANTEQVGLTQKKANFDASFNYMVGVINDNINKIKNYLPEPVAK